ncbi:MAG: Teichoic acids export ATP-binding protein TagH [Owenweeksia sp. TMED14]|nr:MAG: Teichoic acids export ATP-binding protein TagH [Owenweeksia sp. TMED14]
MKLPSNLAIQTEKLGKKYKLRSSESWALKNINLDIETGSALGIVGPNGAGKSTLLKILSGLTKPTTGNYKYRGSLTGLLEVGTGFHPDLSGLENIYLSAALNGMPRKIIRERVDQIIDFSGIPTEYINQPIKHYSSGMKVRLGFAVAAHLDADILIVDEVLAVGDLSFQEKCMRSMELQMHEQGRTVLFVSHNLYTLQKLCSKAILLDRSKLIQIGNSKDVCENYINKTLNRTDNVDLEKREDRNGSGKIRINKLEWSPQLLQTGKKAVLTIGYQAKEELEDVNIKISINGSDGRFLTPLSMHSTNFRPKLIPENGQLTVNIENIPWMKGNYFIDIRVIEKGIVCDDLRLASKFQVHGGNYVKDGDEFHSSKNGVFIPHVWSI